MKRYTIHGVAASQGRELENQPYTACEDSEGLWVKWEDVNGFEKWGFQVYNGYIRVKGIANEMAVSLHQRFDINAATLRFKIKNSGPLIIDVDMDAFEKFMKEPKRMKMTIKDQEIVGIGSWKMTTIPWYLRWWYSWRTKRVYQKKEKI